MQTGQSYGQQNRTQGQQLSGTPFTQNYQPQGTTGGQQHYQPQQQIHSGFMSIPQRQTQERYQVQPPFGQTSAMPEQAAQQQQANAQNQQASQQNAFMEDKDLLYTILCDLKRTAGEYTTAATEASCPNVRQQFTQLLNSTLSLQGKLYQFMNSMNLYKQPAPAIRAEMEQQRQQKAQNWQQIDAFLQQKLASASANHAGSWI